MGLIPSTEDASAREWRGYARTFLSAVLRRCWRSGGVDLAELWRLLTTASAARASPRGRRLPGTAVPGPGERAHVRLDPLGCGVSGRGTGVRGQHSVHAVFPCAAGCASGRGVLFMPYAAGQIAALRSIIAMWMRLAIFEAMNGAGERSASVVRRR